MPPHFKKNVKIFILGFFITAVFLSCEGLMPPARLINFKIYDILTRVEYRLRKQPAKIKDIVIVAIDSETVTKMAHRWPYPRSAFAKVVTNLTLAQAKVIAFDFVFLGKSEDAEDAALASAISNNNKIILASAVDESGSLRIRSNPGISANVPFGVVTKLQDPDGEIRRSLTYLVSDEVPPRGFLSWELAILKAAEGLSLTPIKGNESFISIQNNTCQKWLIPVDSYNKSFIINFRAHTDDFGRVSFYNVYNGNFDRDMIKDKIVLVGFVSSLLGDIHNTPIGWMPGITLNANSLLTLYTQSFITEYPMGIDRFLTVLGVMLALALVILLDTRMAYIFIGIEIAVFFAASYVLLTLGYSWNYFVFPFSVGVFPALSIKTYNWLWGRKKFYWT